MINSSLFLKTFISKGLLLLVFISLGSCEVKRESKLDEALASINTSLIEKTVTLENFSFAFIGNNEKDFSLRVLDNYTGHVWETAQGKQFILAAITSFEAREFAGSFDVEEHHKADCKSQSIDEVKTQDKRMLVMGKLACLEKLVAYTLQFDVDTENHLKMILKVDDQAIGKTGIQFNSDPDEQFFGLGEQFSAFNYKGKRVPVMVSEQGLARGRQPLTAILNIFGKGSGGYWYNSYAPVPHFITSHLRSLALENTEYSILDFSDGNLVLLETFSNELKAHLFFADSPLALISAYTEFSGRMRKLPDWINQGAVLGIQGGSNKVTETVDSLLASGAKLSAVWIQDWQGQRETLLGRRLWWNWELDDTRYHDFESFKEKLASKDIRLMAYINPFLIDAELKEGGYKRNLFKEAKENHYLLLDQKDAPVFISQGSFKAYMVDFSHPEAKRWYKNVIKEQILSQGFSGWMADFGEAMPFESKLQSGESAAVFHNQYPVEWARINREAIDEFSEQASEETVFFNRSAFTHSPGYSTLFWLGDQATNWDNYDGIKTSVTGLLSSGLSGFAFNHGDVGGYFSAKLPFVPHRDEELLMRWIELGAFQAVMRTHEGLLPDENMQVDSNEKLKQHFARFTKVYAALAFYREQLNQEASEYGWPVLRHPFLYYPEEKLFWHFSYQQFLIGDVFWYVPVLDPGVDSVTIHLPKGTWVHVFTGEEVSSSGFSEGITVKAPMGSPAIFYPKGSEEGERFRNELIKLSVIETK